MNFTRQSDIVSADEMSRLSVTVVGAGAIGSHLVECLVKMGVHRIVVWDDDTVEEHNLPNQGYRLCDLGKKKVNALAERMADYGVSITPIDGRVTAETVYDTQIVYMTVDSMDARAMIRLGCENSPDVIYMIDGRMGGRSGRIAAVPVTPEGLAEFDKTMYSSAEAVQLKCTEKATIFNAFCLSGMMAAIIPVVNYGRSSDMVFKDLDTEMLRMI